MAGIEVNRAFIPGQIIDAMRNQLALAGTWEILIQDFDTGLGMGVTFASKVTDQFFLFGVDTDNRITGCQIVRLEASNVFKLGIAVRMCTHGFFLAGLALAQALFSQ